MTARTATRLRFSSLLAAVLWPAAPAAAADEDFQRLLRQGHAAYARGEYAQALSRYQAAVRVSSANALPWLNGGAVLDEAGDPAQAAKWYGRAAALDPSNDETLCALGWAQLRSRDTGYTFGVFSRSLDRIADRIADRILARLQAQIRSDAGRRTSGKGI